MRLSEAAKALASPFLGQDVLFTGCSTDSRTEYKDTLFVALQGEQFDGHDFIHKVEDKASAILISEPTTSSLPSIRVDNTKLAMGRLSAHWRDKFDIPLIAITGSNGKTTVKEMVSSILSQQKNVLVTQGNFNNDIGMPLTLFRLNEQHDLVVLEMGANHKQEIDYLSRLAKPDVAVITQCAPAHLEGFGSIQGVAEAKSEIYHGLKKDGVAIINADDDYAEFWLEKTKHHKQLTFGLNNKADVNASNIQSSTENNHYSFDLNIKEQSVAIKLQVTGQHNIMNALAAASCAFAIDTSLISIKDGLEKFAGVKGRLQIKNTVNGAQLIDDSYNANPTSLLAAMRHLIMLGSETFLVLGDMGELGDQARQLHEEAGRKAKELGVRYLFTYGELAASATQHFGEGAKHFQIKEELISELMKLSSNKSKILVKGSRSMKMEDIVNGITINEGEQC